MIGRVLDLVRWLSVNRLTIIKLFKTTLSYNTEKKDTYLYVFSLSRKGPEGERCTISVQVCVANESLSKYPIYNVSKVCHGILNKNDLF